MDENCGEELVSNYVYKRDIMKSFNEWIKEQHEKDPESYFNGLDEVFRCSKAISG